MKKKWMPNIGSAKGGAGTFGKYLIRKGRGLKRQFSSKIQKYLGTFGLNDLNNLNRKFTYQNTFGPCFYK